MMKKNLYIPLKYRSNIFFKNKFEGIRLQEFFILIEEIVSDYTKKMIY